MDKKVENYTRDQLIKILVSEGLDFNKVVKLKRKELIHIFDNITNSLDKEAVRKKSDDLIKEIELQKKESIMNLINEDKQTDANEELFYRTNFFFEISANERISESNCIIKRGTLMKFSTGKKPEITLNPEEEIKPIKLAEASSVFKEPVKQEVKSINEDLISNNITSKSNSNKVNLFKTNAKNIKKNKSISDINKEKKEITFQTSFTEFSFDPVIKPTLKEKEIAAKSNQKQKEIKSLTKNIDKSQRKEIKEKPNETEINQILFKEKTTIILEKHVDFKARIINDKSLLLSNGSKMNCPFEKSNFFLNKNSSNISRDTNESSSIFKKHNDLSKFNFQNKFTLKSNLAKGSDKCEEIKEETEVSIKKELTSNDVKIMHEEALNKQREDFINLKSLSKLQFTPKNIIRLTPLPRSSIMKDSILEFEYSPEKKAISDDTYIWFGSLAVFSIISGVFLGITQLLRMDMSEFSNLINYLTDYRQLGTIFFAIIILVMMIRFLRK